MIGSLRGVVLERLPGPGGQGELLLEVGGVGYRVTVAASAVASADIGEPLFLHVHTHVREDAIVLYGFATREERGCFEALIAAHGVGPALALAVISVLSPVGLRRALAGGDVDALTAVPGVGRKTAARLLIDLKPRFDLGDDNLVASSDGHDAVRSEVRAALSGLGYGPDEIRQAVADLDPVAGAEEQVRSALRHLASGNRPRVVT
ncbi:MAG: Holliday junction branch migration protein RuvA [Actinomycetota bacterium]|nr:Holliday junction branch migration protein RuvA [Actinomycetota bacterium]